MVDELQGLEEQAKQIIERQPGAVLVGVAALGFVTGLVVAAIKANLTAPVRERL